MTPRALAALHRLARRVGAGRALRPAPGEGRAGHCASSPPKPCGQT